MEQNIHTHLFGTALSLREQRMLFINGVPETPEQHDQLEADLDAALKDPSADPARIEEMVGRLQQSPHLRSAPNLADFGARLEKVEAMKANVRRLQEAQDMTDPAKNAEWKKIEDGIRGRAHNPDAEAERLARTKILFALKNIAEVGTSDPATRPHNAVALTEAYNAIIEKIQALDPQNKITFVENGQGGAIDDQRLVDVRAERGVTTDASSEFAKALKAFDDAPPALKAERKTELQEVAKDRKNKLWAIIEDVATQPKPYVNAQEIIAEVLSQIKDIGDKVNATVNGTPTATPSTPAATPSVTPSSTLDEGLDQLNAEYREKLLASLPIDKVSAVTNAGTPADLQTALDALNALPDVKSNLAAVAAALNTREGRKFDVKVDGDKIVHDTTSAPGSSPSAPAAPQESSDKVSELKQIIEVIKEFLEWLFNKEAEMKGGVNVVALRSRIATLKQKEGELRETNTPESLRKLDEVTQQRIELETEVATLEQQNNNAFNRLKRETQNDPVLQAKQPDGKGTPPVLCNRPGVAPAVAGPQIDALVDGLPPSLRDRVQKKQVNENTVILYIDGDVNITNDQSRDIHVSGINNTADIHVSGMNGDVVADNSVGSPKGINIDGAIPFAPILEANPVEAVPRGDFAEESPFEEVPMEDENPVQAAPSGSLDEVVKTRP